MRWTIKSIPRLLSFAILGAVLPPAPLAGQTAGFDVNFGSGIIVDAPCPTVFPAIYPYSGRTYWGRSVFSMKQYDEYHAGVLFTYTFVGTTSDSRWQITGTHHVAAGQCTSAAYSAWTHTPAVIAYLHNAQVTYNGQAGTGSDCDTYRFVDDTTACEPSSGGTGGGTGETGDDSGGGDQSACEALRLEVNSCYDVYIDGVYQGQICC